MFIFLGGPEFESSISIDITKSQFLYVCVNKRCTEEIVELKTTKFRKSILWIQKMCTSEAIFNNLIRIIII